MTLLNKICLRVARLPVKEQKNLVHWLDWKERRLRLRQREERSLGDAGVLLAGEVWPQEQWTDAPKARKRSNGKKRKTGRRVLGRSR
jgi:hypothetical protein